MSEEKKPKAKSNSSQADALAEKIVETSRDLAKKLPILGNVIWLYHQSTNHRYMFFRDIEHHLMPALTKDQYKLYLHSETGGLPMAFISWAYLSDEAEQIYLETQKIAPKDWDSGDNLWLIDAVSPFSESNALFQQAYQELFQDRQVNVLFPDENGVMQKSSLMEIATIFAMQSADADDNIKH